MAPRTRPPHGGALPYYQRHQAPSGEPAAEAELVAGLLEHCREAMRGSSPIAAEVVASTLCCGWYELAPDLSMHPHLLGSCPPLLMVRALRGNLDAAPELHDVALALARTFQSFDTVDPELTLHAEAIEQELTSRGVTAPGWSGRLGACELVEAHFVTALNGLTSRYVTTWQHAGGEQHVLDVVIDPWECSHAVAIDVTRDGEAVARDLRRIDHMHRGSSFAGVDRATAQEACFALSRTVGTTFDHDLANLRDDPHSLSLFTLLVARSDQLCDALAARDDG